jgi:hypothetical protein
MLAKSARISGPAVQGAADVGADVDPLEAFFTLWNTR